MVRSPRYRLPNLKVYRTLEAVSVPVFRLKFGGGLFAWWVIPVAAAAGIGAANLLLANANSKGASVLIAVIMVVVVVLYLMAVRALSYTRCEKDEMVTRRLIRTRRCPWSQVTDIAVEKFSASATARKPARMVRITTASGKKFRLAAPVDGILIRDPNFDHSLSVINEIWRLESGALA